MNQQPIGGPKANLEEEYEHSGKPKMHEHTILDSEST